MNSSRSSRAARAATWGAVAVLALATAVGSTPVVTAAVAARLACTVVGTPGNDTLIGTSRADVICGRGGNDRIDGRGGGDLLRGGGGNDVLIGGDGADRLYGGPGNDRMSGGPGDDRLHGRGGRDSGSGGPGDDIIFGGPGNDLLTGGPGTDRMAGGHGNDALNGLDAATFEDLLDCGVGRDRAFANRGADVVRSCETRHLRGTPPPPRTPHAPVAVPDTFDATEDTLLALPRTGAGGPAGNDTDADGGILRVVAASAATGGTVELSDAEVRFTPAADLCGAGAGGFDYTVQDPTGRQDRGRVTIDIICAPDEPVARDDEVSVAEDSTAAAVDVLANDSDADGDSLEPTIRIQAAHGTAAASGTTVTYTPDADYCNTPPGSDPDVFTYSLTPSGPSATVSVGVTCVDDTPVAVDDEFLLDEDDAATPLSVLANDTDVDGGPVSIDAVDQPTHGEVTVSGDGSGLTYLPDPDYCNTPPGSDSDSFTYTLAPGGSTATVRVSVTCVSDAAVARDDETTVVEDAAATVVDVLANDEPGDGPPPGVTDVTDPAHGTTSLVSGVVRYLPDADYCNAAPDVDTFDYTISGGSAATVSVRVTCVNDAPTATDVSFASATAAVGNTTLVVDDPSDGYSLPGHPHKKVVGDLLAGASDAETPAAVAVVAETIVTDLGGSVVLEADGDFVYIPPVGCSGASDAFRFTVTDGEETSQAEVVIAQSGCVWYVDSDASGNSGTSAAPFDAVADAVAQGAAGDTLHLGQGGGTYDATVVLKDGQRLIGAASDLTVGGHVLSAGDSAERPVLTRSDGDVVSLADGNLVAGVEIDPAGDGSGVAATAGAGATTLVDVRIIDTGAAGTQPALDLVDTSGSSTVTDLVVDSSAASGTTSGSVGVRLSDAGTVTFSPTGVVSVVTKGARALAVSSTGLGTSVFDQVSVTGSGSGAVDLSNASGSVTFGGLALSTTGTTAALRLQGSGSVTIPNAATANVSATGGPAVDVSSSPGVSLALDSVSSTSSSTDGISLEGLAEGTFTASSGTLSGASGIAFDLDGGSGEVTYGGSIADGTGASVDVTGRTGGTATLSGTIADGSDAGGGVTVSGNSGGSTILSGASKTFSTGAVGAVSMTSSDGHSLRFTGGGLSVTTSSGRALDATASGSLAVSGTGNVLNSSSGRALGVVTTDIGAAGLVFDRISSSGAANGILLDTTGSAGSLQVTGTGGTCTAADTSGCSGGTIASTTGADSASATPVGTGIVLRDTQAPLLTRMWVHDHSNYAIRGSSLRGLTISHSVVNGLNGDNGAAPYDDSSILLTDLTASATISGTHVSGGLEDNLRVANATGSLDRLVLDDVVLAASATRPANDAVSLESSATAGALKATITDSSFQSAAGDLLQVIHSGSGAGDLVMSGNAFSNAHPAIATGGGGVSVFQSGVAGSTTVDVSGNSFRDAVGAGLLFVKNAGTSTQRGIFSDNTIGVVGAANSGSAEGSGLKLQTIGGGSSGWTVSNNQIRGYNNMGIEVLAGGGASAQDGTIVATVTGNTLADPGTTPGTSGLAKQAIHLNIGTQPGDTFLACAAISGNDLASGGADSDPPTINADVRLRQRQSTTIRLPGYGGVPNDNAAVQAFVASANSAGGPTVSASNTVATGGGGFTGAACPVLP